MNISDLEIAYNTISRGLTMKGALYSYSILNYDKTIENRSKSLKTGWYALHNGLSKITSSTESYILSNLPPNIKHPKESELPHGAIVGAIHICENIIFKNNKDIQKNKWATGPICNIIDQKILFENPIKTNGMITLGWKFLDIDKKYHKKEGELLNKVKEEIKKIIDKKKNLNL